MSNFQKLGQRTNAYSLQGLSLLPTNANLGRIMRIMETNISLLELLFVLNNQIIDINI